MFKTARTTAEFLMDGDRVKVGGRPMIVVSTKPSFYAGETVVLLRSPNPLSRDIKTLELPKSKKIKVYNAK